MMRVPFVDLTPMHNEIREEILGAMTHVYDSGWFISGSSCTEFEHLFSDYIGAKYCVGCGNGLDSIQLLLRANGIGEGDEVIVPAHTFIATALAVTYVQATPVFVDVEPLYYDLDPEKLEAAITEKTKAIIAVHIYGQVGRWSEISAIAEKHHLLLFEDAAQAHGATYKGKHAGNLANGAAFSFYPGKNLGALGDGGAVVANVETCADKMRAIGNYGSYKKYQHVYKGLNSRLDEMQAAILSVKIKYLDKWVSDKDRVARLYEQGVSNPRISLPTRNPDGTHAWHIYAIMAEQRDSLQEYLRSRGIETLIHYPVPMHLHQAYSDLGYKVGDFPIAEHVAASELSLPMFYGMSEEQAAHVIQVLNEWK